MNLNRTAIGVIIDRSGSMSSTRDDTIGGFNTFLKDQKALPGEADLTLVLFDTEYTVVHDGVKLTDVPDLTTATYVPRGGTALLDAIGQTINTMGAKLAAIPEDDRPGKVILAILTDGEENSSREYKHDQILGMLKEQQDKYSWEIVYFGANQDAIQVGGLMGLAAGASMNYVADSHGTRSAYAGMSDRVTKSRIN
jgi:uncharacterized protein YegL